MKKITGYLLKTLLINILVIAVSITLWIIGRSDLSYGLIFGILLFFYAFFLTSHYILRKNITDKNFNKAYMIYTGVKLMTFVIIFAVLAFYFRDKIIFTALLIFLLYFIFTFNEVKYLVAKFKDKKQQ